MKRADESFSVGWGFVGTGRMGQEQADQQRKMNRQGEDDADHEIYRCYFKFPQGCPMMQGVNHGAWGLFEKGTGRLMALATPGDLHCGWMSRYWSPQKNAEGIKMGINVLMYYLTH